MLVHCSLARQVSLARPPHRPHLVVVPRKNASTKTREPCPAKHRPRRRTRFPRELRTAKRSNPKRTYAYRYAGIVITMTSGVIFRDLLPRSASPPPRTSRLDLIVVIAIRRASPANSTTTIWQMNTPTSHVSSATDTYKTYET